MGCPAQAWERARTEALDLSSKQRRLLPQTCCRRSCAGEPFLNFLVVQKQTRSHSRLPLQRRQEGEADSRHGNSQLTATWEGQPPAAAFPGPRPSPPSPSRGARWLIFQKYSKYRSCISTEPHLIPLCTCGTGSGTVLPHALGVCVRV